MALTFFLQPLIKKNTSFEVSNLRIVMRHVIWQPAYTLVMPIFLEMCDELFDRYMENYTRKTESSGQQLKPPAGQLNSLQFEIKQLLIRMTAKFSLDIMALFNDYSYFVPVTNMFQEEFPNVTLMLTANMQDDKFFPGNPNVATNIPVLIGIVGLLLEYSFVKKDGVLTLVTNGFLDDCLREEDIKFSASKACFRHHQVDVKMKLQVNVDGINKENDTFTLPEFVVWLAGGGHRNIIDDPKWVGGKCYNPQTLGPGVRAFWKHLDDVLKEAGPPCDRGAEGFLPDYFFDNTRFRSKKGPFVNPKGDSGGNDDDEDPINAFFSSELRKRLFNQKKKGFDADFLKHFDRFAVTQELVSNRMELHSAAAKFLHEHKDLLGCTHTQQHFQFVTAKNVQGNATGNCEHEAMCEHALAVHGERRDWCHKHMEMAGKKLMKMVVMKKNPVTDANAGAPRVNAMRKLGEHWKMTLEEMNAIKVTDEELKAFEIPETSGGKTPKKKKASDGVASDFHCFQEPKMVHLLVQMAVDLAKKNNLALFENPEPASENVCGGEAPDYDSFATMDADKQKEHYLGLLKKLQNSESEVEKLKGELVLTTAI